MLVFVLFIQLFFALPSNMELPPRDVNDTVLLNRVNEYRATGCTCEGVYYPPVAALTWNKALEKAALSHCKYMERTNRFSHEGKKGTQPSDRITKAGYRWKMCAENIAAGDLNEEQVIDAWIKSPHHCKNMMNKDLKEMGVARSGKYWTQDFGAAMDAIGSAKE